MASLSNSLHIFWNHAPPETVCGLWMGEVTSLRSEPLAGSHCPGSAADGLLDDGLAEYEARRCWQIRSRFAGNHHIAHRAWYFPYCQLANWPLLERTSRHRKPRENQWPKILKYMSSLKATNLKYMANMISIVVGVTHPQTGLSNVGCSRCCRGNFPEWICNLQDVGISWRPI